MVEETSCVIVSEPLSVNAANVRVSFIEGPDGYVVELMEDLE